MYENTKTKTSPTLTEKDLAKDCPEVTTVRTTGELLDSPMSTYTAQKIRELANQPGKKARKIIKQNAAICMAKPQTIYSLCAPVFVPQMAGTGDPPLTKRRSRQ